MQRDGKNCETFGPVIESFTYHSFTVQGDIRSWVSFG
jgi:hypothetical protein